MHVRTKAGLVVGIVALGVGAVLAAQGQRASPHETASATVDGAKITVEYGRPYMKGRKIFGGLVPIGQVWRTGADEATILTTDATLALGILTVPPGKYSLFTIPGESEWTLIVNKQTGQWGTRYDAGQDLGRTTMKTQPTGGAVEQFEIKISDTAAGGELRFQWENTRAIAPFVVKR
jgi:hypothetical protein